LLEIAYTYSSKGRKPGGTGHITLHKLTQINMDMKNINVENLWKKYRIGAKVNSEPNLGTDFKAPNCCGGGDGKRSDVKKHALVCSSFEK
jgi:hypothetical protein